MLLNIIKISIMTFVVFILAMILTLGVEIAPLIEGLIPLEKNSTIWAIWHITTWFIAILIGVLLGWLINKFIFKNTFPSLFDKTKIPNLKQSLFWIAFTLILMSTILITYALLGIVEISYFGKTSFIFAILFSFCIALFPGIVEEIAYRYLFYGYLKTKMPKIFAIFIAGIVFGIIHLDQVANTFDGVLLMFAAMGVTLLFIAIYEKTGSIWRGALVHTVWDTFTLNSGIIITNVTELEYAPTQSGLEYLKFIITSRNSIISGGSFGVESGIITILSFFIAAYIVWKIPKDFILVK